MKTLLKISLLILLPLLANSQTQQQQLDSLYQVLKVASNDYELMSAYYSLAVHFTESDTDSTLYYLEQSLSISKKVNQPLWVAKNLLWKAYINQRNLPFSLKLINDALAIAQEEKNEEGAYIDNFERSELNPHSLRLQQVAFGANLKGNLQTLKIEEAIPYYQTAIRIGEETKYAKLLVVTHLNLGSIYIKLNKPDSSYRYFTKALEYSIATNNKTYRGDIFRLIGTYYLMKDRVDSSRYFYWKSILSCREENNLTRVSKTMISLAKLYKNIAHSDSMLIYGKRALAIATQLGDANEMAISSEIVSSAFKIKGNTDSAFVYLSFSKKIMDSLNNVGREKLTQFLNINFEEQMKLEKEAQDNIASNNRIRTVGLISGLVLLSLLALVFYRNYREKQKANLVLQEQKNKVESTLHELKSTQSQLIQSEKMASLGELTAGIAHEIQNPLNFVNNFSEVSNELIDEMNQELEKGEIDEAKSIAKDVKQNLEKINHHGKRAGDIVKGMLQHSRTSSGVKEPTDINALADEYFRLAYHGLRAKDKTFNATMKTDFDETIGNINVVPQDIGRVILNLITNAFYAVNERQKLLATSNKLLANYEPTVSVSTKKEGNKVLVSVKDNGNGIPQKILDKIFQPFFTTKPTGQGTGLGLSLSYDIVKAHGGELKVETLPAEVATLAGKEGEGSEFIVQLPIV